jgi:hypothetical protein
MTATILLGMAVYTAGCVPALVFFFIGRAPSLVERTWHWPVIFLWPLLPFWPLRSIFRRLLIWK